MRTNASATYSAIGRRVPGRTNSANTAAVNRADSANPTAAFRGTLSAETIAAFPLRGSDSDTTGDTAGTPKTPSVRRRANPNQ